MLVNWSQKEIKLSKLARQVRQGEAYLLKSNESCFVWEKIIWKYKPWKSCGVTIILYSINHQYQYGAFIH